MTPWGFVEMLKSWCTAPATKAEPLYTSESPDHWCIVDGTVVDLDLLHEIGHPGGKSLLMLSHGRDASVMYHSVHTMCSQEVVRMRLRASTFGEAAKFPHIQATAAEAAGKGEAEDFVFDWGDSASQFSRDLIAAVRQHFKKSASERGISIRQASKAPPAKWALVISVWLGYFIAFAAWLNGSWTGFFWLPFLGALGTFHCAHDSSHGALSSRAWVNELTTFSGFLINSPSEWRWQHIAGHHAFTNIRGGDPDAKHTNRWTHPKPGQERLSALLAPLIWLIAVPIGLQALQTLRLFAPTLAPKYTPHFGDAGGPAPPIISVPSMVAMLVQRLFCYAVPIWRYGLLGGTFWAMCPAAIFSFLFMLNTQLAHLNEETENDQRPQSKCWYKHQLATTVDFATDSRLHWFVSGGLNLQVPHHLFPCVDHWHLPALRPIIQQVCKEHGVPMSCFAGYGAGIVSHYNLLTGKVTAEEAADALVVAGGAGGAAGQKGAPAAAAVTAGAGAAAETSGGADAAADAGSDELGDGSSPAAAAAVSRAALAGEGSKPRVCIVGSGITGNGAAYFLRKDCDVTLVERDDRLGGHAHTAEVDGGRRVDVGFQVFNYSNYPLLSKLFDELCVETVQSDMSLSVAVRGYGAGRDCEWSSHALFPTWASMLNPRSWVRVYEILCFEQKAREAVAAGNLGDITMKDWLSQGGFSNHLQDEYLGPMSAALWSCPTEQVLDFPAHTVFNFFENHFLLQRARPRWRTPLRRSGDYVGRLRKVFLSSGVKVRSSCEVARLEQQPCGRIAVIDVQGRWVDKEPFDRVVLATHANISMEVVRRSTLPAADLDHVEDVLGKFKYFPNDVIVHSDSRCMPKNRPCWGAWNALEMPGVSSVTYWINILQPGASPQEEDVFVTLNPPEGYVEESKVLRRFVLDHPMLDRNALRAQRRLHELQGGVDGRLFFCGAWSCYGFHEDGLRSARDVCVAMGVDMSQWPAARGDLVLPSALTRFVWQRMAAPALNSSLRCGTLRVVFGNGQETLVGGGAAEGAGSVQAGGPTIELRVRAERFVWRLLSDTVSGLEEGVSEGEAFVREEHREDLQKMIASMRAKSSQAGQGLSPMKFAAKLAMGFFFPAVIQGVGGNTASAAAGGSQ